MDHEKKETERHKREREKDEPAHGEPRVAEEMERIAETNLPKADETDEAETEEPDRGAARPGSRS